MTNTFLPEDYTEPKLSDTGIKSKGGKYLKFLDGATVFRILGEPIRGWEYWVTVDGKRKPKRIKEGEKIPQDELEADPETGEPDLPKFFWAMPVYVEEDNLVKILEITQKSIRTAIEALIRSKGWGNPLDYDIEVTRSGEKFETKYTVMPQPKSELSDSSKDVIDQMLPSINLEALFTGDDPFKPNDGTEEINVDDVKF